MSLAAFPIQTSDMPRRPLRKQHSQAHGNAVLGENPPKNNALEAWFLSQTTLTDPPNGRLILKTALADPLNGHRILKTTLADPLNGRLILKTSLTDPLNGRLILKATLTDPLDGHLFRKTPLQKTRRQVFHEKQRKTFRLFGSASSPHGMQQKAGCRETRSTTACLYINNQSAFNPTISHSRSPADGADWRSWDTCAHNS